MDTVRAVRPMDNTQTALYMATTASTPLQTPVATLPAPTGLDWTTLIITALLSALVSGSVVAALINAHFQGRSREKDRDHSEKLDNAKRAHELELQKLKYEYDTKLEDYRQEQQGRKKIIETWEELLNNPQLGIYELTNHPKYGRLEEQFTKEFLTELGEYIEYSLLVNDGIIPPTTAQEKYLRPSDEEFRDKLKQALTQLKREWGLY